MAEQKNDVNKAGNDSPHADALEALEKMVKPPADAPASGAAHIAPPSPPAGRPQKSIPVALPVNERPMPPPAMRLRGGSLVPTPTPRPVADDEFRPLTANEQLGESGSASGFVSILAKGMDGSDPIPQGPVVMPAVLAGGANPVTRPGKKQKTLRQKLAEQTERRLGAPSAPHVRDIPNWYHAAAPLMLVVSGLLAVVSLWATVGSIALVTRTQGMPLVRILEEGEAGDFWYYMPYIMLVCIPVSAALAWMGMGMRKQIMMSRRRFR